MSDRLSTKAGVFESGEKDVMGVQYKDGRVIACRNSKLEDYTVADGTEVICDRAFMNLKELRSIEMPASLRAIGESAFSGCKALVDINIPEGVTEIRQATFRDCDALAAIELPASVTEIDKFAFGRGLTTLVVNAPEMKIDRYAFMNALDFSILMVPAGTADYYRALLADMRVKADVEEREDKVEEVVEEKCCGLIVEMDEDQYIGLESDDYNNDNSEEEEDQNDEKHGLIDQRRKYDKTNPNKTMEKETKDDGLRTIKFTLSSYGERIDLFDDQDNQIKSIFRGMLYDDDPDYFLDQYEIDPAGDDAMDAALDYYAPLSEVWTSRDEDADEHDPHDEIFYKSSRDLEVDYEDEKWDHYEITPIKISGIAEIKLPMDAEFDVDKCHLIANSVVLPDGRNSSLYIMGFCYDGEYYPLVIDVDSEQETGDDYEDEEEDW